MPSPIPQTCAECGGVDHANPDRAAVVLEVSESCHLCGWTPSTPVPTPPEVGRTRPDRIGYAREG